MSDEDRIVTLDIGWGSAVVADIDGVKACLVSGFPNAPESLSNADAGGVGPSWERVTEELEALGYADQPFDVTVIQQVPPDPIQEVVPEELDAHNVVAPDAGSFNCKSPSGDTVAASTEHPVVRAEAGDSIPAQGADFALRFHHPSDEFARNTIDERTAGDDIENQDEAAEEARYSSLVSEIDSPLGNVLVCGAARYEAVQAAVNRRAQTRMGETMAAHVMPDESLDDPELAALAEQHVDEETFEKLREYTDEETAGDLNKEVKQGLAKITLEQLEPSDIRAFNEEFQQELDALIVSPVVTDPDRRPDIATGVERLQQRQQAGGPPDRLFQLFQTVKPTAVHFTSDVPSRRLLPSGEDISKMSIAATTVSTGSEPVDRPFDDVGRVVMDERSLTPDRLRDELRETADDIVLEDDDSGPDDNDIVPDDEDGQGVV